MKPKQSTSKDLIGDLLAFLQRKFYADDAVSFAKDKRRLLQWVVLWPASWLHKRGVSVPEDKYREIFMAVFVQALQLGNTGSITYRPAWLAKVIQSHFDHHGDEIYAQAKSMRSLAENALMVTGKFAQPSQPDLTRDLALASQLLSAPKLKRKKVTGATINLELKLS